MKKIPDGYQNEFLFVLEFNNKKVKELNPLLREVIDDIFYNINEDSIIKAWRNPCNNEKGDILLKIENQTRFISVKKGSRNSVHLESIISFKDFLKELGVSDKIIYYYELFHYGVNRRDYNQILSSKEFCSKNKRKIKKINQALTKIDIEKIIDRFILQGKISEHRVSGIISGVPNDFMWINSNDIVNSIKSNINRESSAVHISSLYIQPMNRCINGNKKYEWCKEFIQVKWYSLFDDIIMQKNRNMMEKKLHKYHEQEGNTQTLQH